MLLHDALGSLRIPGPDGIDDQSVIVEAILHPEGTDNVLHGDFENALQDVVDLDDDGIAGGLGKNEMELQVGTGKFGYVLA